MNDELRELLCKANYEKQQYIIKEDRAIYEVAHKYTSQVLLNIWQKLAEKWMKSFDDEDLLTVWIRCMLPKNIDLYALEEEGYLYNLKEVVRARNYNSRNPHNIIVFVVENSISNGEQNGVVMVPILYDELIKALLEDGVDIDQSMLEFRVKITKAKFDELVVIAQRIDEPRGDVNKNR